MKSQLKAANLSAFENWLYFISTNEILKFSQPKFN